jgi:hypothetical protein
MKLKDEDAAIELGHTWRKFFGYIQLCNVTPELNIVLFNEASVRIFHNLSKHDIIYIDATGKLFADKLNHTRLLYYAMVLQDPYHLNAPIPISELISSRQAADSTGLMIRKLKERSKYLGLKVGTPSLLMSDFSMAIIIACLREFNNKSYEEFLERGYRIFMGEASCSFGTHATNYQKTHEKYLSIDSQVHMAMRFFGDLIASTTLQELNNIVRLGHYIFKSKYVILDNFSDVVRDFNKGHCEKEDEMCNEINDSAKTDFEN